MNLSKEQKTAIFTAKGLCGSQLTAAVNTKVLTKSQKEATFASLTFSGSMKTLGTTLKTAFLANPLGWLTLGATAIYGIVKVFDHFNESVKESKEKLTEYQDEYKNATSQIESLTSELDSVRNKMNEINKLEGTKLTKDGELEALLQQEDSLERQLAIERERQALAQKGATEKAEKILSDTSKSKINPTVQTTVEDINDYGPSETYVVSRSNMLTPTEALREATDEATRQSNALDRLTVKQQQAKKEHGEESAAYKNLQKEIEKTTKARDKAREVAATQNEEIATTVKGIDETSEVYKSATEAMNYYGDALLHLETNSPQAPPPSTPKTEPQQEDPDPFHLEPIQSSLDAQSLLATALKELSESGTLTKDTFDNLKTNFSDFDTMLTQTASGVEVNRQALAAYHKQQKAINGEKLDQKMKELSDAYNKNWVQLGIYNRRLEEDTSLTKESKASLTALISGLNNQRESIAGNILDLQYLQLEYQNSISKYNEFMTALNTPDSGSHYDSITSSIQTIKEEFAQGLVGTDQFRAFVDYMTYADMSTASVEELKAAYEEAMNQANLYFNSTDGSQNFLNKLQELQLASKDENGLWSVNIEDMEEAAQNAGISVEALKDNLEKLKEYGHTINIKEGLSFQDLEQDYNNVLDKINELKSLNPTELASYGLDQSSLDEELKILENRKVEIEAVIKLQEEEIFNNLVGEIQKIQAQINASPILLKPNYSDDLDALVQKQQELAVQAGITIEQALTINVDDTQVTAATENAATVQVEANTQPAQDAIQTVVNGSYTSYVNVIARTIGFQQTMNGLTKGSNQTSFTTSWKSTAPIATSWTGSAFVDGSWKVGYTGKALVGELGKELLVRNGIALPIGENGAQYINLKSDDIIFNHVQTKQLEQNGKIHSRGKAFSSGSVKAFSSGSINWIDRQFELLNTKQQEQKDRADSADLSYLGQSSRASALATLLELDRIALEKYQAAVSHFQQQYDELSSQISEEIKGKIEQGDLSIGDYSPEEAETIQKVMDAYDELQDYKEKQRDQQNQYSDDQKSYYENQLDYLDKQAEKLDSQNDLIQSQIGYLEESGQIVDASTYEMLIRNLQQQEAIYRQKLAKLQAQMAQMLQENPQYSDTEEYYDLQEQIQSVESAIWDSETAQEEYNNKLLQMPIDHLNTLVDMYGDITDAIENWGDQMEASGKKLDADYYRTLIDNGLTIIDQLKEEADLIRDVMDEYDVGSEKWQDLYNQLQDINGQMSSMVKNLYKWNEALLQMPLTAINEQISQLKMVYDGMQDLQSDYDTVIGAVTNAIGKQKDLLNEEKDAAGKDYQSRIDQLQSHLDLMAKQNEALKVQTAYEQALYELQRANTQKTEKVIRNGQMVYENNADQLKNAQENVQDALEGLKEYEIKKEIEGLSEELESINSQYDEQIEKLDKIAQAWDNIKTSTEEARDAALADQYLGSGWADKILGGQGDDLLKAFQSSYETNAGLLEQYDKQIQATENIYALLENYIASYKDGTLTYEQAMLGIEGILSQMNSDLSAGQNIQNILDFLGQANQTNASASDVLKGVQESLKTSSEEMLKSLKEYNDNLDLIADCMTTWEELTSNVAEIRDLIEEVRDNLEDAIDAIRDRNSRDDDDDEELENDLDGAQSSGTITSGGRPSSDYGPGTGIPSPQYQDGVERGLVGMAPTTTGDSLRLMSTRKLKPGEIPALLHRGEAVLNSGQQNTLLQNIQTALIPSPLPSWDFASMATQQPHSIEINMGDTLLKDVRDVDGFAKALGSQFKLLLRQELGKL